MCASQESQVSFRNPNQIVNADIFVRSLFSLPTIESQETLQREHALFQGRFQPPSIAHLSTVEAILKKWKKLTIGIVYNSPRPANMDPRLREYADMVDEHSYALGKNPFTPEETKAMWERALERAGLSDRVQCIFVKRQEYEEAFDMLFPPDSIDIVKPEIANSDSEADRIHKEVFTKVYERTIEHVRPEIVLHNSEIRRRVFSGEGEWSDYIPPGAYELFLHFNGPQRIAEAEKLLQQRKK